MTVPAMPGAQRAGQRLAALVESIHDSLEYLEALGLAGGACPLELIARMETWDRPLPPLKVEAPPMTLAAIREDLGDCQRCPLAAGRTRIVFGSGPERARMVFVGEGPGAEEDQRGEPFVGAAGQLLTRIIAAMTLTREQVYISNVVKCRPPGNRTPEEGEIAACSPFLRRQIAAIGPEFVVALGTVAAQTLLNTRETVGRLRGRLHDGAGYRILATYHPAYLLRNPEQKRAVWHDMQLLMKVSGLA